MKTHISSPYMALADHRAAVDRTLRRMGHDVIGMEQYIAEGGRTTPTGRVVTSIEPHEPFIAPAPT